MGYRFVHPIIEKVLVAASLFLCGLPLFLAPTALFAGPTMDKEVIAIRTEQQYWKQWIAAKNDKTCPLQPFVLSYTRTNLASADKLIKKLGVHDNAALFLRVNIDNGIMELAYWTWDDAGHFLHSVRGDGIRGRFTVSKVDMANHKLVELLHDLTGLGEFVDLHNFQTLDADSMYLTISKKGKATRYASYAPAIVYDADIDVTLSQFAQYLRLAATEKRLQ